jgi:hypothetical protein
MFKVAAAIFLVSQVFSNHSQASVLTFGPGSNTIQGVTVSDTAVSSVADRHSNLVHVASSLRTKFVAITHVKVYVAQLFASDHSKFDCTEGGALNSVDNQQTVALSMAFLRNVDAQTVSTSFEESFAANGVSLSDASISAFLKTIQEAGPAASNTNWIIVGEKLPDGTEAVTFENSHGQSTTTVGQKGFIKSVLSIWLGQPASGDGDLGSLIKKLSTCASS